MIVKAAKHNITFYGDILRFGKDVLVIEDDDQKGLEAAKLEIAAGRLVEVTDEEIADIEEILDLNEMTDEQLKEIASEMGIKGYGNMKRETLISSIEEQNDQETGE
jgi:hypothetical protein